VGCIDNGCGKLDGANMPTLHPVHQEIGNTASKSKLWIPGSWITNARYRSVRLDPTAQLLLVTTPSVGYNGLPLTATLEGV